MCMSGPGASEMHFRAVGLLLILAMGGLACNGKQNLRPDGRQSIYDLDYPQAGGGRFRLGQCRDKVMVIDFFATWSQASLVAIPGYNLMFRKHSNRDFCMLGIALDDLGMQVVAPYVRGLGVDYPVLAADEDMREGRSPFGSLTAIPSLMIFDREGSLVGVFLGLVPPKRIEEVLDRLLR